MENRVLATVNGRDITEQELQDIILRVPAQQRQQFATEEGRNQLLKQIVDFELMNLYSVSKGFDKEEEFTQVLNAQFETLKKELLTQYGINKVLSDITVSNEEVKAFYEEHRADFFTGEKLQAKHILVDSEEKANEVLTQIVEGKSFEDAAAEFSSCPSKEVGGDLGMFSRGQMVPEFEQAAFAGEIGKLVGPVKTQFGYHLIYVVAKEEAGIKSFEEVAMHIRQRLINERQQATYQNLLNSLAKEYNADIKA